MKQQGWPNNKVALVNPLTYDFSAEALQLFKSAKAALRDGRHDLGLSFARRSWLLDQKPKTAQFLANLYRKKGFVLDAAYYEFYFLTYSQRMERLRQHPNDQVRTAVQKMTKK